MLNQFEFIDDIANELDIDAEHVKANIEKYGLNGDKLDHRNGVWYDSKEDGDFNDKISRIHMRYDENANYHRSEEGIPDYRYAEADGIQVGPWNAEIGGFVK